MDQQARTGSQLRSQGFQQAQAGAQQATNQQLRQAQLTGQLGVSGGLGQLGQQMGVQDINTLLGIGGLQQQQGQKNLMSQEQTLQNKHCLINKLDLCLTYLEVFHHYNKQLLPTKSEQRITVDGIGNPGLGAIGSLEDW